MEKNEQCAIVRDLLSTYSEGLTSEATTHWIEEHLADCRKCKREYENLQELMEMERLREAGIRKKFKRSMRRWGYQFVGIIIGIVLICALLWGGLYIGISKAGRILNETVKKGVELETDEKPIWKE